MKRILFVFIVSLSACSGNGVVSSGPSIAQSREVTTSTTTTRFSSFPLPNPNLTPGDVSGTNIADICPHVNPALEAARPNETVKNQVYAEYGITSHTSGQYEIDHLIPLELDGSNSSANLWPEPNDHPRPGVLNSKDELENKLHSMVCSGQIALPEAQHEISSNWLTVFNKYLAEDSK